LPNLDKKVDKISDKLHWLESYLYDNSLPEIDKKIAEIFQKVKRLTKLESNSLDLESYLYERKFPAIDKKLKEISDYLEQNKL
jgi:hypothetical protein